MRGGHGDNATSAIGAPHDAAFGIHEAVGWTMKCLDAYERRILHEMASTDESVVEFVDDAEEAKLRELVDRGLANVIGISEFNTPVYGVSSLGRLMLAATAGVV